MHWPHQPTRSGQKPMQENRTFMQAFCGNDPICQDQTESWRERKKKTHCLSWANRTILTYLCVCMSTPNTLYITIKVWSMHKERRGFFFFFSRDNPQLPRVQNIFGFASWIPQMALGYQPGSSFFRRSKYVKQVCNESSQATGRSCWGRGGGWIIPSFWVMSSCSRSYEMYTSAFSPQRNIFLEIFAVILCCCFSQSGYSGNAISGCTYMIL